MSRGFAPQPSEAKLTPESKAAVARALNTVADAFSIGEVKQALVQLARDVQQQVSKEMRWPQQ